MIVTDPALVGGRKVEARMLVWLGRPASPAVSLILLIQVRTRPERRNQDMLTLHSCRRWSPCHATRHVAYGHAAGSHNHNLVGAYGCLWAISPNEVCALSGSRLRIILCVVANHISERSGHIRCSNSCQVFWGWCQLPHHHWRPHARRD
jgi:hypothetical protein